MRKMSRRTALGVAALAPAAALAQPVATKTPSPEFVQYQRAFEAWWKSVQDYSDAGEPKEMDADMDAFIDAVSTARDAVIARPVHCWEDLGEIALVVYAELCTGTGDTFDMHSTNEEIEGALVQAAVSLAHGMFGEWPPAVVAFDISAFRAAQEQGGANV